MKKEIHEMTEKEVAVHLDDLKNLARKMNREIADEMRKFKFRVKYFSGQSLAHLYATLIGYAVCSYTEEIGSPALANDVYTRVVELIEAMKKGNNH